ncbi:EF-hand calcium-binding domain-containing protein 4A [Periophthalmus magnuspinnatus]|uniref:EF-hand calcium-binding domain-containing protein 4A n=1 Tax=Periophthalmus magnuspinnatus TaxID=409849 RepID=UPI00145B2C74|nr:EF-hand calcium-binding domain-containing protein 4A [Periophthalmus magnuspinnatus]
MSHRMEFGEVLVGEGSAEAIPASPRSRWSPRRPQCRLSPQEELMGKAKELFELCDKEGKGFITKRDMQRLEGEVPLSPEQLETVFESLDRQGNGFLTPLEFNTGLGELMSLQETVEDQPEQEDCDGHTVSSHDAAALRFANTLSELGGDRLFRSHAELCSLWCELEKDSPALLALLEEVLAQALSDLQDSIREKDSLEQALHRREAEHDQMIRSLYEEMENQIKEERDKQAAEDSVKQKQRNQQLEQQLKIRTQELELSLSKNKEMENRMRQMSHDQSKVKEQNQQLHKATAQLQEQLENSQQHLQTALNQLSLLQDMADQEAQTKHRNVLKVSRNMQKEKDSLMRQLELLRDMNKRLRDEKDARLETQRRVIHRRPMTQYLYPP